jgi:hypothetical protein
MYLISVLCFSFLVFNQIHYLRYLYPVSALYCLLLILVFEGIEIKAALSRKILEWVLLLCVGINILNVKSLNMFYRFDFSGFTKPASSSFTNYNEKPLNEYVNSDYGSSAVVLYLHPQRPYTASLNGTGLKYHWTSQIIMSEVNRIKSLHDLKEFVSKYNVTHVIFDKDSQVSSSIREHNPLNVGWRKELFSGDPLEIYKLLPQLAELQRSSGSVELWRVGVIPIFPNEIIKLNDTSISRLLVRGWLPQEPWGVWSEGDSASMNVKILSEQISTYLHININAMPYSPADRVDDMHVQVYANKVFIKEIDLKPIQFTKIDIDIPKSVISNENITLDFLFSKPFDNRRLQLGFSEMSFEYK